MSARAPAPARRCRRRRSAGRPWTGRCRRPGRSPCRRTGPAVARMSSWPANGGTTMAYRNGTSVPSVSLIRSPVTSSNATPVRAVMPSFFRNIFSSFSPPGRPPMPKWPTNGSEVTKVSGTLLLQLGLAQLVGGVEQELVRRAETARALGRGDHDRPRVIEELLPRVARPFGVRQRRDRLGVSRGSGPARRRTCCGSRWRPPGSRTRSCRWLGHRAGGRVDGVASACTNSIPWSANVGPTGNVMSCGLRLPNGSQMRLGLKRK